MTVVFELDEPCTNCKGNTWRIGLRTQRGLTEFLCVACGAVVYTNLTREEFDYLQGAD